MTFGISIKTAGTSVIDTTTYVGNIKQQGTLASIYDYSWTKRTAPIPLLPSELLAFKANQFVSLWSSSTFYGGDKAFDCTVNFTVDYAIINNIRLENNNHGLKILKEDGTTLFNSNDSSFRIKGYGRGSLVSYNANPSGYTGGTILTIPISPGDYIIPIPFFAGIGLLSNVDYNSCLSMVPGVNFVSSTRIDFGITEIWEGYDAGARYPDYSSFCYLIGTPV